MGSKKGKRKSEVPKPSRPASSAGRERSSRRAAPATRREPRFTTIVPVRFEPAMLDAVRARAAADGRSVSAWIRRTVQLELGRAADRDPDAGLSGRPSVTTEDSR